MAVQIEASKKARIEELVELLNKARKAYEQDDIEIMSNYEYDALYDELGALEKETGYYMKNSPTQNVGYEVVSNLAKEKHPEPMLSQDKTKSREELAKFAGKHKSLLSWKMDGLTVVIYYENGNLVKAVTRGNGEIGEVVTHNAKTIKNLPKNIAFKGKLVMRGEAVIKYSDFAKINAGITDEAQKFKNPRNLCSGAIRQLNSEIAASRSIYWNAFTLVSAEGMNFTSIEDQLKWLKQLGFGVVDFLVVNETNMLTAISKFENAIKNYDIPSDGLVLVYDDIAYGKSLGNTSKHPRNSIAFKWKDDTAETRLIDIEWSVGKTGIITPVAIFEPVDLEGTTVQRASVHNVSILAKLLGQRPYVGQKIWVYKANMIIPSISKSVKLEDLLKIPGAAKNISNIEIPKICPICGGPTQLAQDPKSGVYNLYCTNPNCVAKNISILSHFVTRDAMNIDGMSDSKIGDLVGAGVLKNFADFYTLNQHADVITSLDGWGKRAYTKMIEAIEKSKDVQVANFIYALSIPGIGLSTSKLICKALNNDIRAICTATPEILAQIDGIGPVLANNFVQYMANPVNRQVITELCKYVRFKQATLVASTATGGANLKGITFCVTGSVQRFSNRKNVGKVIEDLGGSLTSSVSSKTNYLITNDTTSGSSKNVAAQKLGIPILSEDDFINKFNLQAYVF